MFSRSMGIGGIAIVVVLVRGIPGGAAPLFAVRTEIKGLDYRNICGEPEQLPILDQNGQGIGLIDFDDDGLIDVIVPNGSNARLMKEGSNPGPRLYRNLGNWRFEDATEQAGMACGAIGNGVAIADYDEDGDFDVYLTNWGKNALFRNEGGGKFRNVTIEAGVGGADRWNSSAAFADFNGDGRLDLIVSRYVDFDPAHVPNTEADGGPCLYKGIETGCGPWRYAGQEAVLFLQGGAGQFRDASEEWGLEVTSGFRGFGVIASDLDRDGDTDVFIACDVMPNLHLDNVEKRRFRTHGYVSGLAVNSDGKHESGMGVAAVDWRGDGWVDLFVTNFAMEKNTHYAHRGDRFEDVSLKTGLDAHPVELGWAIFAEDFNQDGEPDIFVCNGHIYPQVDRLNDAEDRYAQPARVYLGADGRLTERAPEDGFDRPGRWSLRGAAAGDLDNDGDIDLLAVQHNGPLIAFENKSNRASLAIELKSRAGGRSPHDARVRIGRRWRVLLPNQGYQSSKDPRMLIPLKEGDDLSELSDLRVLIVQWPNRRSERFALPEDAAQKARKLQSRKEPGIIRWICREGEGQSIETVEPKRERK